MLSTLYGRGFDSRLRQGDADFVYQYGKYEAYKANDIERARRAIEERSAPIAVIKELPNE